MRKIRTAIIGTGQIGKMHLDRYATLTDKAEVVAVCDINEAEATRVAQKYGIPHVYTDFRKLLARDDIEAVDVCLHNNYHANVSIAAMQAGKHVYCEKPIAGTYDDGKRMLEASKETGRKLHIQLGYLYWKDTKAAKALIEGGHLGRIYHARSTGFRRRGRPFVDGYGTAFFTKKETAGGGALFDVGVYNISRMLYLLDMPKVERIRGKVYQEVEMDAARREQSGYDVEEFALGFVSFEHGLTMDIMESWAVHMGEFEGSSLFGSKGGIRLPTSTTNNNPNSNPNSKFTYYTKIGDMDMDCYTNVESLDNRKHLINGNDDAYDGSLQHWIATLQGRVELLPTAELGLQMMLIAEGIYLSDSLGREVSVEEVAAQSKSKAIVL